MSVEKVIQEIDGFDQNEREKVIKHIFDKYSQDAAIIEASWWNQNENDDIYEVTDPEEKRELLEALEGEKNGENPILYDSKLDNMLDESNFK